MVKKISRVDTWLVEVNSVPMMNIKQSDGSTLTVITDSIFLTGVTEVNKNRAMSTIDVSNAFI